MLPTLANCIIGLSTTTRSFFIDIAVSFVVSFFILTTGGVRKPIKVHHIFYICAFVALFFVGGYFMKGRGDSFAIIDNIFGYSAAGLYGLDDYIRNSWAPNTAFGMRTLKPIYDLIGSDVAKNINNVVNVPYTWSKSGTESNIYSSLVYPIQDYGVIGMMLIRMLFVYVYVRLCHALLHSNVIDAKGMVIFYFVVQNARALIYTPISDSFYTIYSNIRTNIIIIIITIIAFRCLLYFRLWDDNEGRKQSGRHMFQLYTRNK